MGSKHVLQQMVVVIFLLITLSGFLFAVLRVRVPFVPWFLTYLSYSAMAPYQGMSMENQALAAQGQRHGGTWEEIDLLPYYPLARGKQDIRMLEIGWMRMAEEGSEDPEQAYRRKCRALARTVLHRERSSGREFVKVRLSWDHWPLSSGGHDALYDSSQRKRIVLAEYP